MIWCLKLCWRCVPYCTCLHMLAWKHVAPHSIADVCQSSQCTQLSTCVHVHVIYMDLCGETWTIMDSYTKRMQQSAFKTCSVSADCHMQNCRAVSTWQCVFLCSNEFPCGTVWHWMEKCSTTCGVNRPLLTVGSRVFPGAVPRMWNGLKALTVIACPVSICALFRSWRSRIGPDHFLTRWCKTHLNRVLVLRKVAVFMSFIYVSVNSAWLVMRLCLYRFWII